MKRTSLYVDGSPCTNAPRGCGGIYRRRLHTGRGLCSSCCHDGRMHPPPHAAEPCKCGCGVLVAQWPRRRMYASSKCCATVSNKGRAPKKTPEWRATRVERKPAMKYIHEVRAEVNARGLAHLCMYCEANPVKTPGGDTCTDRECLTLWNSDYARGRREYARQTRAAREPVRRQCECPCRRAFSTNAPSRRWFSAECRNKANRKKRAASTGRQRAPGILFGSGKAFPGRTYAAG